MQQPQKLLHLIYSLVNPINKILNYLLKNLICKIKTILCASFCGTGKTFICENSQFKAVEVEYWKYKGVEKEFLQDVKKLIGVVPAT